MKYHETARGPGGRPLCTWRSGLPALRYAVAWLASPARSPGPPRPVLPTQLNFPVTDNSNARWVRSLAPAVPVRVIACERGPIADALAGVDRVVYAGGPVMDLPTMLVPHLETALGARRRGLAFEAEGVGVGPFKLAASRFAAKRLLALAERVFVRSRSAGADPMASAWMQRIGLEWLFRLVTEPRRLWKRYLRHNPRFAIRFLGQLLGARRAPVDGVFRSPDREGPSAPGGNPPARVEGRSRPGTPRDKDPVGSGRSGSA